MTDPQRMPLAQPRGTVPAPKDPQQRMFADFRAQLHSTQFRERIASLAPSQFRSVSYIERLCESVFIAVRDNPDLLTKCDRGSVFRAAERIAKRGLTVGENVAWIVPYKGQAQDQLGWRGAQMLVRRSGLVERFACQAVYERDRIKISLGSQQGIVHEPELAGDRGECIGVYAMAWVKGEDDPEIEWLSKSEIEKIRQNSPSANSPAWQRWWPEMARAKCIKRLCKRLPVERAIDLKDMDDREAREIEGISEAMSLDIPLASPPRPVPLPDPGPEPDWDEDGVIEEEEQEPKPKPQPPPAAAKAPVEGKPMGPPPPAEKAVPAPDRRPPPQAGR